ncbi:MAG TPA: Hpt domain-containing protein [Polyangiaceae bacterium]
MAPSSNVIRAFLRHVPAQLERIEQALSSSDPNELKEAAHKLKGGCSMFGATRMAELCRQLEMGEGDFQALHQSLLREFQVVCASLPKPPPIE